ncbi:MAG TPA: glycosyltransferase family 1 protein [Deltaproteobacteria bacterium]|nr:glycosyltransferase family 1 protein [Deltaproteobacteria bacterium]
MDRPCRVLVLNERDPEHPAAGGAEFHVVEIFRRLCARGYDVTLASSGFSGGASRARVDGLSVRRLGRLPFYYPRVAAFCARGTRRGDFDVVVECLNKVPFFSPVYSAVPVLALCHHLFGEVAFRQVAWPIAATVWASERLIPPLYGRCPFITISESSRDDLVGRGIDESRIQVSHCGVEGTEIGVDVDRVRSPRVAYMGRIEPYKRVDVLLRAMARLSDRFPDAEILIIGRGSARPALEELAKELGLRDRVRFTGFVDDVERDRLLAGCRVCVCASEKEGWGLTVIESNRLGTPVVASDVPGLRDSVRDGETGLLARYGDVEAFASAIGRLLDDDGLALGMSRAALEWSGHFDWDRSASEMAEAIERARSAS